VKLEKKVCGNCMHLFISGMFQSWGATSGYCLLMKNENEISKSQIKTIKGINDTCLKFERKLNKTNE